MATQASELIPADACAVQPRRVIGEDLRLYEGVTWPTSSDKRATLLTFFRRMPGGVVEDNTGFGLDVLNANHDIVAEFYITREGFKYLRDRWHFRRIFADWG